MNKAGSLHNEIVDILEESAQIKKAMAKTMVGGIEQMANLIIAALKAGGKVVLFGNGGSAADAQHIAGELVGRFKLDRQALPAMLSISEMGHFLNRTLWHNQAASTSSLRPRL